MALCVAGTTLIAPPALAQEEPGELFTEWHDDELYVPHTTLMGVHPTAFEADAALSTLAPDPYCSANAQASVFQVDAAAGRIMGPEVEHVVLVEPSPPLSSLFVGFADAYEDDCIHPLPAIVTLGPSGVPAAPALAPPTVLSSGVRLPYVYDTAVGDLDREEDELGHPHDEVVVAYASGTAGTTHAVTLAVLDYSAASGDPDVPPVITLASGSANVDMASMGLPAVQVASIPLKVSTGDFNGDGIQEIAVAYLSGPYSLTVEIFEYVTTVDELGDKHHFLIRRSSVVSFPSTSGLTADATYGYRLAGWTRGFDVTAVDADRDGRDELVAAVTTQGRDSGDTRNAAGIDLQMFEVSDTLIVEYPQRAVVLVVYSSSGTPAHAPVGVQLASGLMRFDETGDVTPSHLVLAYVDASKVLEVATFDWTAAPTLTQLGGVNITTTGWPGFWVTAGGLQGLRQSTGEAADLVWSIALGTWTMAGYELWLIAPEAVSGFPELRSHSVLSTAQLGETGASTAHVPPVAYDRDGDALFLGRPLHMTLESLLQTKAIIQEPPKHTYWDKHTNEVKMISRFDGVAATMTTESSQSFNSSTKSYADYSVGASSETSATATIKKPGPLISTKTTVGFKATVGYEFEHHKEDMSSGTATVRYGAEYRTTSDDIVTCTRHTIDIWRYRVYGTEPVDEKGVEQPGNSFLDVSIPRSTPEPDTKGGLSFASWYQPLHENGNILSYPVTLRPQARFVLPSGARCDLTAS